MNTILSRLFLPNTLALVLGLGITCTIGYGTLFYSFSLLSIELEQHFLWSKEFIFGVFSFGILCSGFMAPVIGKCLDRYGAWTLMSLGSVIVAICLLALSQINNKLSFIFTLVILEMASLLVLYESAFVALTQYVGKKARYPIAQITLMAGFASTIFWPLISWLLTFLDWRSVYIILALLHLLVCFPVHFFVLGDKHKVNIGEADIKSRQYGQNGGGNWGRVKWIVAIALGCGAFAIAALQIHLFYILKVFDIDSALAVTLGALLGPFQVVSRLVDMCFGHKITPIMLGVISFLMMSVGVVGLFVLHFVPDFIWLFSIAFGAGQGLAYIVRGAIPLFLFGSHDYGAVTGDLNRLRMILTAMAPFTFALMIQYWGVYIALLTLLALLLLSVGLLFSLRKCRQDTFNST
ncbi:MAG: MFS transporter [Cellvibrionaceae bacterium]